MKSNNTALDRILEILKGMSVYEVNQLIDLVKVQITMMSTINKEQSIILNKSISHYTLNHMPLDIFMQIYNISNIPEFKDEGNISFSMNDIG